MGALMLGFCSARNASAAGNEKRIIPQLPAQEKQLRLLIDTDIANEIDDLYAVALALTSPDRFSIEGFVATHWAAHSGPDSIDKSYMCLLELLEIAGQAGKYTVKKGGHPMQYLNTPSKSEGANLIIERAFCGNKDNPLWVVGLGAATNLASALLIEPSISERVRYVFHARSHLTWPERSVQFNVENDILAVRSLLQSNVPLVWFDTGTYLTRSIDDTEAKIASSGRLGKYLHDYRYKDSVFMSEKKGFFDVGDIVWLIKPELCRTEIVKAPTMSQTMYFDHKNTNGDMLRVYEIDREGSWNLFDERIAR
jgi:inosine-uridine nucleoside N-ribohydrolase